MKDGKKKVNILAKHCLDFGLKPYENEEFRMKTMSFFWVQTQFNAPPVLTGAMTR